MPTDAIKYKDARINDIPVEFLSKIPKAESEVYDKVVELMAKLDVKNGSFVINKKNIQIISQIAEELRGALLGSSYTEAVADFVKQFDQQAVLNEKLIRTLFPSFTSSEIANQIVAISKRNAVDLFMNQASNLDFVAPLRSTIEQAIYSGSGYQETLTTIRDFIKGADGELGALEKYSKTYAHDSFAVADSTYTATVSKELGAEWFYYTNGLIKTSRVFCRERAGQYFHIKEIEGWFKNPVIRQPGQKTPMITTKKGVTGPHWDGMWLGENADNFFNYRGGYWCGHSVLPQSLYAVPKAVVQRNIDSGNFKPTPKQLELLGW